MQSSNSNRLSASRGRRPFRSVVLGCAALLLLVTGCRNEMYDQARFEPLEQSTFFPDSQASRPLLEGTVARGQLRIDQQFYTGKAPAGSRPAAQTGAPSGSPAGDSSGVMTSPAPSAAGATRVGVETFPFGMTRADLLRGQERFNIFCSPCHGRTGDGKGMIVQRGMQQPPSFHLDELRAAPAGHFYDVITNGFGAMYPYASRIKPDDRWRIVAYIRALQLSQNATANDLPPEERQKLESMNR